MNITAAEEFTNITTNSNTTLYENVSNYTSMMSPQNPNLPLQNTTNSGRDSADVLANLLAIGWVFVIMWCCCQRRPPDRRHWRGEEIRRRYLEIQERRRAREERKQQTPQYRQSLVQYNMRTKRVTAKDDEGNLTLGPIHVDDSSNASQATCRNYSVDDVDNEDEHACVICLDSFQVGDVVSWSRFSEDCHHVYHADCIQPWLDRKRQDDCPSCRNKLLLQEPLRDLEKGVDGSVSEDDHDCEKENLEKEEDSFFVIVHGLIARAAKHASYTLIGTKDSIDEKEMSPSQSPLSSPSPFRRVVSFDPRRPSPLDTIITGGLRRNSCVTPSNLQTIEAVRSFESEEADDKEVHVEEHIPFRRVKSDIGMTSRRRTVYSLGNDRNCHAKATESELVEDKRAILETLRQSGLSLQALQHDSAHETSGNTNNCPNEEEHYEEIHPTTSTTDAIVIQCTNTDDGTINHKDYRRNLSNECNVDYEQV